MILELILAAIIAQARIEGTVVNSVTAAPIRKVEVTIHSADNLNNYSAITSGEGKFVIEHIKAGDYRVLAARTGYLEKMNGRIRLDELSNLDNITIKLSPAGVVSGRVIDDDGDPVPEVVVVLGEDDARGDAEGHFVFTGLKPGRYVLSAMVYDLPNKTDEETFIRSEYPAPIDIKVGTEIRNLEIHMRKERAFTVRGKISQRPSEPLNLRLTPKTPGRPERKTRTEPDGSFEFDGVAAGPYLIRVNQTIAVDHVTGDYIHKAPLFYCNFPVEVSQTLKDILVPVGPSATIHGKLRFLGPKPETLPRFEIFGQGLAPKLEVQDDATFQLANLPWGDYHVSFNERVPSGNYVQMIRWNAEVTPHSKLDLNSGGAAELEIVFAPNAAEISGKLPKGGAAYLWQDEEPARLPLLSPGGEFVFRSLAPGEYSVVALEDGTTLGHDDPETRKQFADYIKTVKVGEGDHARVELKIVPTQEQ